MKRTRLILLAILLLGGAAACDTEHGTVPTGPTPTASVAAHSDVDVAFVRMMIAHHQQAVELATLAQGKASQPDLRQFAFDIKLTQRRQITTMTGWLTAWDVRSDAPLGQEMAGDLLTDAQLAGLRKASGLAFDRQFTQLMIEHHTTGIAAAQSEQANGLNSDVRALAASIVEDQTAEVTLLRGILTRLTPS